MPKASASVIVIMAVSVPLLRKVEGAALITEWVASAGPGTKAALPGWPMTPPPIVPVRVATTALVAEVRVAV